MKKSRMLVFLFAALVMVLSYSSQVFAKTALVILPLKPDSVSTEMDYNWLANGLKNALRLAVSNVQTIELPQDAFSFEDVKKIYDSISKTDTKELKKAAQKSGADFVLLGSYNVEAENITVNLQLLDEKDAAVKKEIKLTEQMSNLVTLNTKAAVEVVKALGVQTTTDELARVKQPATTSSEAFNWWCMGNRYVGGNLLEKAASCFRKAISLDANYYDAYINLGTTYIYTKSYQKAIQTLQKAIELNPKETRAYKSLGLVYMERKLYDKAEIALNKATTVNKADAEVYLFLASLYDVWKKPEEAVAILQAANKVCGDDYTVWLNLGIRLLKIKKNAEAIAAYEKAKAVKPNSPEVHFSIGNFYNELDKNDEAISAFSKAVELDQDFMEARNNLGIAYFKKKDYNAAIKIYNELIKDDGKYAYAYYNLACIFSVQKKFSDAMKNLKISFELASELIDNAKTDPDLDNLRGLDEFKELMSDY